MTKENKKDIQDELIEGALKQAWDIGFNYGVAWMLKKLEEGAKKENGEDITELLKTMESSEQFKGITEIYQNIGQNED